MSRANLCFAAAVVLVLIEQIFGHGVLVQPISRSSVWQEYPGKGEVNNYFNAVSCGGGLIPDVSVQFQKNINSRCYEIYFVK